MTGSVTKFGVVKWFNNAKGYGFIVEEGHNEDLFAHYSAICMDGYRTLKAGQKVSFETKPGSKGSHAVNITIISSDGVDVYSSKVVKYHGG